MSAVASSRYRNPAAPVSEASTIRGCAARAQDLLILPMEALLSLHDRARQRHRLGGLDERMLRDIGVDRATAALEAEKPFWRR